jgi:hypothetical protein
MTIPAPIEVLDADNGRVAINAPLSPGRAAATDSRPVVLSTEDKAVLDSLDTKLSTLHTDLTGLSGFVDGVEALITSTNGYVDGLEGLATSLNGYVDGLETQTGGVTETAPATDTASSGLNGRLQRIAQRLTTLLGAGATTIAKAEDAASADADVGVPAMAVRKATPANTSGTDGDYEMLQMSAGRLWVSTVLEAGAALIGKFGIDQTTPGTTNGVVVNSSALPTGAATAAKQPAIGTAGTASADVVTVQGIASMTALKVDGSAVTQPVSLVSVPSHAVTNVGTFAVQSTVADGVNVVEGAVADAVVAAGAAGSISAKLRAISRDLVANIVLAAGSNLIGRAVADASAATGGIASTARLASAAASTNATFVKGSAGRIYSVSGKNNAAYDVFLVLYDAATNPPVPGTTAIRKKIVCPTGAAFVYDWPVGLSFATGIGYAFTKLVADADTTVLVAADVSAFNLDYV